MATRAVIWTLRQTERALGLLPALSQQHQERYWAGLEERLFAQHRRDRHRPSGQLLEGIRTVVMFALMT